MKVFSLTFISVLLLITWVLLLHLSYSATHVLSLFVYTFISDIDHVYTFEREINQTLLQYVSSSSVLPYPILTPMAVYRVKKPTPRCIVT